MIDFATRLDIRSLVLVLGGITVVLGLSAFSYVLKPTYGELRALQEGRRAAGGALSSAPARQGADNDDDTLRASVDSLREELIGSHDIPASAMASYVLRTLDKLSERHNVLLSAVRPGKQAPNGNFIEVPFDIEASGEYFALHKWVVDAERSLRPLVMKEFGLKAQSSGEVNIQLRLVAYRTRTETL